jgi:hypothetical protein
MSKVPGPIEDNGHVDDTSHIASYSTGWNSDKCCDLHYTWKLVRRLILHINQSLTQTPHKPDRTSTLRNAGSSSPPLFAEGAVRLMQVHLVVVVHACTLEANQYNSTTTISM